MLIPNEPSEKTVRFLAEKFNAQYIIVMESERTYIKLEENYRENIQLKLIQMPRSPGVATMDEMNKKIANNVHYKNYFNGEMNNLDTFEVGLDLKDYKLYTTEIVKIPLSAQPHGAQEELKIFVKQVDPLKIPLQNKIVGVLDPVNVEQLEKYEKEIAEGENANKEEFYGCIITSICRSLIHVKNYDQDNNRLIVNASSPDALKSKYLIVKDLIYEKDTI